VEQASGLSHSASLSAKALAAADGRIAGSEGHRAGRPLRQARMPKMMEKIQVAPSGSKWLKPFSNIFIFGETIENSGV